MAKSKSGKAKPKKKGKKHQKHPKMSNNTLVSPEILPGNAVAFRIYAPNAKTVELKSDDHSDKVEFTKDKKGFWEGIWTDVEPGMYRYRFLVDGILVLDPRGPAFRETPSMLTVTEGDEFFAMKEDVPHGAISQRYYVSEILGETRRMHVWSPAGYEKSADQLPVLYLIHGGGDRDNAWSTVGCAGNILDNLLAEGKIAPMLVVMPDAFELGRRDMPILNRVPLFKQDLMAGIIPFVEENYNVYADADHRAIMGLSFGGLETLEAITFDPDMFGYAGVLSSGWWITDAWKAKRGKNWMDDRDARLTQLTKVAAGLNAMKLLMFTQGGPEDLAYDNGLATLKLFDDAGITFTFSQSPGGHTWKVWRENLRDIAPLLFR